MDLIINPMLEQGFAVPEIVYKKRNGNFVADGETKSNYDDGRIGWRKFAPRPVFSLMVGDEFVYDDSGGIQGINQMLSRGKVSIPIERLLHFRTTMYPANSPWGQPIHRSMYVPYWYSQNMQEIEEIGVERDLAGIPIVYLGDDCTLTGTDSDYEKAVELVSNIRRDEQAGIVVPKAKMGLGDTGRGMLVELLSTQGRRQWDVDKIIERYDKRKALVVLAQFIMLGMEKVGSFALATNQTDLFELAAGAFLTSIADVFNRHAIPRLINMNVFSGITGYPKMQPSAFGIPNLHSISQFVNNLVDKEVLTPDEELERHLRQLAKLPPRKGDASGRFSDGNTANSVQTGEDSVDKSAITKSGGDNGATDLARGEIESLHSQLGAMVLSLGIGGALDAYRKRMSEILIKSYRTAWSAGRGVDVSESEYADFVDGYYGEQTAYLDDYMKSLGGELRNAHTVGELNALTERTMHRASMYAGGAWAVYNQAIVYGANENSLWYWSGGVDEHTCATCQYQVDAGVRKLKDIDVFPAADTECGVNCRHTMVRVR